jgi:thiosulfate/3-mercaptopyruvate sulfurtransferase
MAVAILRTVGARASLGPSRWSFHSYQSLRMDAQRSFSSYLVTPKELHEALKKNPPSNNKINTLPRTVPLCAAWFLPNDSRNGLDTFRAKRIPNARFFDLEKVIDRRSPYPHMLPSASEFASAMSALGIRRDDTVVVYDTQELGIFSAPRVGWTLKVFGHDQVHILNNFKIWVEEGYPTESGEFYSVDACPYPIPAVDESKVAEFAEVKEAAHDHNKEGAEGVQILDARPYGRWAGTSPEPRPGLSSGHMPGSISMPFSDLLDPTTKAFLSAEELKKVFQSKGVDPAKPIISTCGTGTTAAIIDTALNVAEYGDQKSHRLYDGSWT